MGRSKDEANELRKLILEAIEAHWLKYHYGLTIRDIVVFIEKVLDYEPSTSVIDYHIRVLKEQGLIDYEEKLSRTIRLTSMVISFPERSQDDGNYNQG
jgi:hypothetical protein